ncbi:MAG: 8-oxo-dGTP diphosphatase [Myxococcales bacterium]|nr:8-oxo-dGTP diphosphatase [Myxococcales bacterium]
MPYQPIVATLGYVMSPDGARVLMIHRDAREDDHHLGKYNGLGGKLARDEDVVSGMRREIHEESGLEVLEMKLAGTINWPGFGKHGEDWLGFIFRVEAFRGECLERSAEGRLEWVERERVLDLPLWEGDRYFLPLVFAEPLRPFHGVMPYDGGSPVDWRVSYLDERPTSR